MMNFVLMLLVKAFMSFAGVTLTEDAEVYLVDYDAYETKYEEMDYNETINFERYFDKEEEVGIYINGVVYDNGDEFYLIDFDNNDFNFGIVVDGSYDVIAYTMSWY